MRQILKQVYADTILNQQNSYFKSYTLLFYFNKDVFQRGYFKNINDGILFWSLQIALDQRFFYHDVVSSLVFFFFFFFFFSFFQRFFWWQCRCNRFPNIRKLAN